MLEAQKTVIDMLSKMKAAVLAGNINRYKILSDELATFSLATILPAEPVNWHRYRLTRTQKMICETLYRNMGRVISKDVMMNHLYFNRPDPPHDKIIDILMCKIRPKLQGSPFEIVTHWGQGWAMENVQISKVAA